MCLRSPYNSETLPFYSEKSLSTISDYFDAWAVVNAHHTQVHSNRRSLTSVTASSHHSRCPESGPVTLTSSIGYISLSRNSVSRCPWRLSADSLQRISFTLYRFEKERMDKVMTDGLCQCSLQFEEDSAKVKEYSLCRVANRETNVYNSRTNRITAYVHCKHNMALPVTYLLKYEGMSITFSDDMHVWRYHRSCIIPDVVHNLLLRSLMISIQMNSLDQSFT